ncbi:hypothetical protein DRJ00_08310 [Candidatus Aerophobetes bacterium]|uniref:Uncharacterized protein n=1 Tax=Aerophobetes bacterium TaxID=2030807 RepID=A0A497E3J3_UNCAE|nr:MAG: hypothetical protein DRJ00_08310 [Candidatus Aerophobetes bacterium]
MIQNPYETITPEDWGIQKPNEEGKKKVFKYLGISYEELEKRWKNAVYKFAASHFDNKVGACHHFYLAKAKCFNGFDSGNFLIGINFLIMYDRYKDKEMLDKTEKCFWYAYENCTDIHPMHTWQGGVRCGEKPWELYVKYTGDAVLAATALYRRTKNDRYLFCLKQFHNFLKQARQQGFKFKFNTNTYKWTDTGYCWRSFGFPLVGYIKMYAITSEEKYLENARAWADYGLSLQADNGCFYLLDNMFWNSDLTAPELRGLVFLYEITKEEKYLNSAIKFANWLIKHQRDDGAWPTGIDREDEVCAPHVAPGDPANIGVSLIRLHKVTGEKKYLNSAMQTVKYSIKMQAAEGGAYPHCLDDPRVHWGFWSWDPPYDKWDLSGDQSVHHIRGMMFVADYLANL